MTLRDLHSQLNMNPRVRDVFHRHSLRVMYLSTHLARRVGFRSRDLAVAALLHDVGKVGITEDVILKPDTLTALEFAVVQSHCQLGEWLCDRFVGNPAAAKFIRHHHERWDSQGYPDGLKGEEIPLESRVISVCDVFDTLVAEERPYRQSTWSIQNAIAELRRCAGTQFDGALVDAFATMIAERPSLVTTRGAKPAPQATAHWSTASAGT